MKILPFTLPQNSNRLIPQAPHSEQSFAAFLAEQGEEFPLATKALGFDETGVFGRGGGGTDHDQSKDMLAPHAKFSELMPFEVTPSKPVKSGGSVVPALPVIWGFEHHEANVSDQGRSLFSKMSSVSSESDVGAKCALPALPAEIGDTARACGDSSGEGPSSLAHSGASAERNRRLRRSNGFRVDVLGVDADTVSVQVSGIDISNINIGNIMVAAKNIGLLFGVDIKTFQFFREAR